MDSTQALIKTMLLTSDINSPFIDKAIAISVPNTSVSTSPFTVYSATIGGQWGARLATGSIAVDSIFQTNYNWNFVLTGATSTNNTFQPFDPTVNTFDIVPNGKFIIVKPGTRLTIQAYNNTSTTSDGIMSVYVVADLLKQDEAGLIFGSFLAVAPGSGVGHPRLNVPYDISD